MDLWRKYNTQTDIYFPLIKAGSNNFALAADYTHASGDVKVSKDGGAAATASNAPTNVVMGNASMWKLTLTATEMQAAKVMVIVSDAATKAVEDQMINIVTYGNASAEYLWDLSATMNQALYIGQPGSGPERFLSGVTDQYLYFSAINSSDHVTLLSGKTSADFTIHRSRNGSTPVAWTTPTVIELSAANMPGRYALLMDEDMTIDAGDYIQQMILRIQCTGMDVVSKAVELVRRDVDAPTKGVALSDIPVYMVDSTDHVTPKTGLSLTVQVSQNAGAFAGATGTAAEVGNGLYQYDASAADMNADVVVLKFTATGADPFLTAIKTVP